MGSGRVGRGGEKGFLGLQSRLRVLETESHRYRWEKDFDDSPTISAFFLRQNWQNLVQRDSSGILPLTRGPSLHATVRSSGGWPHTRSCLSWHWHWFHAPKCMTPIPVFICLYPYLHSYPYLHVCIHCILPFSLNKSVEPCSEHAGSLTSI